MKNILLFEAYNKSLNILNDVQNFLSQFPYLSYQIDSTNDGVKIKFNKDVTYKYAFGLFDGFVVETESKEPVVLIVTGKKDTSGIKKADGKIIIQNIEKIDIPKLGIKNLEVKCDTGASSSSLSCEYISPNTKEKTVTFIPLNKDFEQYKGRKVTLPIYSQVKIQSSNGESQNRYMVKLSVIIKGVEIKTFISLSDREGLEYPALIGKDVLAGFLINPC